MVFIEELGEKRIVNYDQLEPLPLEEVRPWAPPYRFSRANSQFLTLSQMLQQIGLISLILLCMSSAQIVFFYILQKLTTYSII
jgi:hypothetical protein